MGQNGHIQTAISPARIFHFMYYHYELVLYTVIYG